MVLQKKITKAQYQTNRTVTDFAPLKQHENTILIQQMRDRQIYTYKAMSMYSNNTTEQ